MSLRTDSVAQFPPGWRVWRLWGPWWPVWRAGASCLWLVDDCDGALCLQRKLPEQDIAQGSYIALPLALLVLLAGYNHDKVGRVGPGDRKVAGSGPRH